MALLFLTVFGILVGLISMFFVNSMAFQEEAETRDVDNEEEKSSSNLSLDLKIKRALYVFLIVFSVWALVDILLYAEQTSHYKEERTDATLSDVVSSFGLEPGKEYPITIGGASDTSILVAFEGDNGSYVLEIPVSRVTFDIRRGVKEASMSVDVPKTPEPRSVAYWQHSYACNNTWSYGWVRVDCTPLPSHLIVSDEVRSQGLASVMDGAFNKGSAGVKVTLPPSMYNNILGVKAE
jgi:hypothetical protein